MSWRLEFLLMSAAAVACDGSASLEHRACPCTTGYVCCEVTGLCITSGTACELVVTPSKSKTNIRGELAFIASVPVTWSVDEANGGSIEASGAYRAPIRPGDYHVRATTSSGASVTASVAVGPKELVQFVGVRGGSGAADGVGADARFSRLWNVTGDGEYLYVWDELKIRRISQAAWEVKTFGGSGQWWYIFPALAVAGTTLFAATIGWSGGGAVVRIDRESGVVAPLAGDLSHPFQEVAKDGIGASARFAQIDAMVADATTLYVVDGQLLRKVDVDTGKVTTLAAWPPDSALTDSASPVRDSMTLHDGGLYLISASSSVDAGDAWRRHAIWRYDLTTGAITDAALAPKYDAKTTGVPASHFVSAMCFSEALQQMIGIVGNCLAVLDGGGPPSCFDQSPKLSSRAWMHCQTPPQNGWLPRTEIFTVSDGSTALWRTRVGFGQTAQTEPVAGLEANQGASPFPGTNVKLDAPASIAADSNGTVAVAAAGGLLVASGMEFSFYEDIQGLVEPKLSLYSSALALDGQGNVYFSTLSVGLGKIHLATGERVVLSGDGARGLAHDGRRMLYATRGDGVDRIDTVSGTVERLWDGEYFGPIVVDGDECLYVAKRSGIGSPYDTVVRADLRDGTLTILPSPKDGWDAVALAYDPAGVLYVAEPEHQRVRGMDVKTGEVVELVGKAGSSGVKIGPLPAGLNEPVGIALLPGGSLAIADHGENVVVVAQ